MRLISAGVFGRCGRQAALGALLALLALQPLAARNRGITGLRQMALADAGPAARTPAGPVFAANARLVNGP